MNPDCGLPSLHFVLLSSLSLRLWLSHVTICLLCAFYIASNLTVDYSQFNVEEGMELNLVPCGSDLQISLTG